MNLFQRFFVVLLGFALAPVLVTGIWIVNSNEAVRENARQFHQQVAELAADTLEGAAAQINRAMGFVEDLNRNAGKDPSLDTKIIQKAAFLHSSFALISLLDPSDKEVFKIANPQLFPERVYEDRSSDPLVQAVRKSGEASFGPILEREGMPLISIAHPLDDGRMLFIQYSLRNLWRRIKQQKVGRQGRLLLVDAQGRALPGLPEGFPEPDWQGLGSMDRPSGWMDHLRTRNGVMVGAFQHAPSLGIWTLSLQARSEAFARSDRFPVHVATFLFALSVLVIGGAYWLSQRLTFPLTQMIVGAQRASRSDFNQPVPELGWGELNLLSKSFNQMMGTLKAYQELQVDRIMEEKAKVEALVRNIPDGIILAGFDGHILYINVAARLILGVAGDYTTTPKDRQLHDMVREPALRDMIIRLLRKQKRSDLVELEIKGADGLSRGLFHCAAVAVGGAKGDIGILIVMRDVTTERKLDQMKEDFFHSIVHDLRSPISSIDGFVELMQKRADGFGDKERKYLDYIQTSSKLLRDLVNNILEMAKLESGTMKLEPALAQAPEILESIRKIYAIQGESKKVSILFNLGQRPHGLVCDRPLIERVIMNLMGNALKYTPSGGQITLEIGAVEAGQMEFSVTDTGPGIPKNQLDAVFEKFRQLDDGVSRKGGYGLGLAICKKVVELHGGKIWVESEQGKGSRFVFRIPHQMAVQQTAGTTA
ncbi:MAG: hypothetical protein HY549_00960 [Elusimicrobia bacterium]|nr:hypothetical protein [Elusimicrobiota bacterium]